jgi:hypothetical protein
MIKEEKKYIWNIYQFIIKRERRKRKKKEKLVHRDKGCGTCNMIYVIRDMEYEIQIWDLQYEFK